MAPRVPLEAGAVRLSLPAGWRELAVPVAIPGLRLKDGRAAAPQTGGAVLAGLASRAAHTPALLPDELLDALGLREGVVPERDEVRLGTLAAFRYEGLRPRGLRRAMTLYVAPTTAGVATLACVAPLAPADCAEAAAGLSVDGATGFALGPDRALGDAVEGILARLAREVRNSGDDLRAARRRVGRRPPPGASVPAIARRAARSRACDRALPTSAPSTGSPTRRAGRAARTATSPRPRAPWARSATAPPPPRLARRSGASPPHWTGSAPPATRL